MLPSSPVKKIITERPCNPHSALWSVTLRY